MEKYKEINDSNYLYEWYKIKQIAKSIFNDFSFEIYFAKNIFYQILNSSNEIRENLTNPENEIEIKKWLIASNQLHQEFKRVAGYSKNGDIEEWCEIMEVKYNEDEHDEIIDINDQIIEIITKSFEANELLEFFTNDNMILTQEEYISNYCSLNEAIMKNEEYLYELEEEKYENYKSEIQVTFVNNHNHYDAESWVQDL